MSQADIQYLDLVKKILDTENLYDTRTQFRAKKVFGHLFEFDLQKEFPILTTKKVFFKSLLRELLWIYVKGSNKVSEVGSSIWDEWADDNGTIGKAYGFQARHWPKYDIDRFGNAETYEIDQVSVLLDKLKSNPQDRGMIINLWNVADLPYMALRPCAFMTMWDVNDGHLNCTLVQRSGDVPAGIPFNMAQYAILVHMFAHVSGLKAGKLNHYINNAHIYENQIEPIKQQLDREPYPSPTLWINPSVTNFFDFTEDDIKLIDYNHHPYIDMGEIAV